MRKVSLLKHLRVFILSVLCFKFSCGQIANHVNNGSFEDKWNCLIPSVTTVKYWRSIDSSVSSGVGFYSTCFPNVPSGWLTYQWPRTGENFIYPGLLCQPPQCTSYRGYARNRLKANLNPGKIYCIKFYVCVGNPSSYGIDGIGAYFGDDNLDTITKCNIPLTYLIPQIQNPIGNIITDTLNWTLITGTFVANGNEKHMVIGNFKTDAATTKTLINSTNLPTVFTDVCIDDVSCIDIDLPAYAGPDVFCIPGNSVYIGRQRDVGIDEACMWYKLPNMTTAIDTAAGIWVSPTATSTYVVRQEICAGIKYDTVVVTMSGLGFDDFYSEMDSYFTLSPNPSKDKIELNYKLNDHAKITIQNNLGQIIREEEISFINSKYSLSYSLPNGIYFITISNNKHKPITKKLIVHG